MSGARMHLSSRSPSPPTSDRWWHLSLPLAAIIALPCVLADNPAATAAGLALLAVIFWLPGHFILARLSGGTPRSPATAFAFGLGLVTTAYDLCARAGAATIFFVLLAALVVGALVDGARTIRHRSKRTDGEGVGSETVLAGAATALVIAPLFWSSGRLDGGAIDFFGPAGQNAFLHLALVERLLHHVPPDNVLVAGLRAPFYHYFADQALALVVRAAEATRLGTMSVLDVALRAWPTALYFALGALAYRIGRISLGSVKGGVLSVLVLLGAGGLTWIFGLLQVAVQVPDPTGMRLALFPEWTAGDGFGSIRSLVSRPAQAAGLLFSLAALDVLLTPARRRTDWVVAGLLLGLMAGFNYTLAATLGIAALLACSTLLLLRRVGEAHEIGWLTAALFVGALPANAIMVGGALDHAAPRALLIGPTLALPIDIWGGILGHLVPSALLPLACLILFALVAYGVRLVGLPALLRGEIAGLAHRGVGLMLAIAFAFSFLIGTFFTFSQIGGAPDEKILLQPTLWMLGLFGLRSLLAWLERSVWRAVALWSVLALTWGQSLLALDFSQKVSFSTETALALRAVRDAASADDVVAFLPVTRVATALMGEPQASADFAIPALTGLRGYFSTERYSVGYAIAGLAGATGDERRAAARALAGQRATDTQSYLDGTADSEALRRLAGDNVRWIVVAGAETTVAPALRPWRRTDEISVYRLPGL